MAEERGATLVGGVEAEVRGLVKDVAELKGIVSQMDKRMSNVEGSVNGIRQEIGSLRQEASKDNRQVIWVVLGTWATTILAVITMSLTILSRLK